MGNYRNVDIYRSNERCEYKWEWVVSVADDPEFWLSTFDSKADAIEFCSRNGFSYIVKEGQGNGERL